MLVLSRKSNQSLHIGNDIVVTIVRVRGDVVRIGIEAPKDVKIMRNELIEKLAGLTENLAPSQLQVVAPNEAASTPAGTANELNGQATDESALEDDSNPDDGPMCDEVLSNDVLSGGPLAKFCRPQLRPLFANAT